MDIQLNVTRADAGRLLAYTRERRKKAKKGLDKFADNFDEEKGANMRSAYEAACAIERDLKEKIDAYDRDHPRESSAYRDERQGRGR